MNKLSSCVYNYHGRCDSAVRNPDGLVKPSRWTCARCGQYRNMVKRWNTVLLDQVQESRRLIERQCIRPMRQIGEAQG